MPELMDAMKQAGKAQLAIIFIQSTKQNTLLLITGVKMKRERMYIRGTTTRLRMAK